MENNWIDVTGDECPVEKGIIVDVMLASGEELFGVEACRYGLGNYGEVEDIEKWRLHKPEQSLDDALGLPAGVTPFVYPQTPFKPSSEAQLRSDEAARVNSLLSEKLSTIADIASKLTRKNFSVADIKLVKDLLESVEEYEENK